MLLRQGKPPASNKQPHVTPKVSNPIDVNKTLSQYNNQAQSESETEGVTPREEESGTPNGEEGEEAGKETGAIGKPLKSPSIPEGIATVMKVVSLPVVAITPIMQNARKSAGFLAAYPMVTKRYANITSLSIVVTTFRTGRGSW